MARSSLESEQELEKKARDIARSKFGDMAVLIHREQTSTSRFNKLRKKGRSLMSPTPSLLSLQVSPFLSHHVKIGERRSYRQTSSQHSLSSLAREKENIDLKPASDNGENDDENFSTWPKLRDRSVNVKDSGLIGSPIVPRFRRSENLEAVRSSDSSGSYFREDEDETSYLRYTETGKAKQRDSGEEVEHDELIVGEMSPVEAPPVPMGFQTRKLASSNGKQLVSKYSPRIRSPRSVKEREIVVSQSLPSSNFFPDKLNKINTNINNNNSNKKKFPENEIAPSVKSSYCSLA